MIDPHEQFRGGLGGAFGPSDQAELFRNIADTGVGEAVYVIALPSVAAARAWKERNIGLLWIDGDHAYGGVHSDFVAWFPFLTAKAIVAFHDFESEGVRQTIREFTDQGKLPHLGTVEQMSSFQWRDNGM